MKDQELILRFFALLFEGDKYKKPMNRFLNKYMYRNRELIAHPKEKLARVFDETIELARRALGPNAFKRKRIVNVAVFDAVMVGLARRLAKGPVSDPGDVKRRYDELLSSPEFVAASETATSDEESITRRVALAVGAFADAQ
jgi:hypothetical protein